MSNTTSENSSLDEILQEKSVVLGICRTHLITYQVILDDLEEFLQGEKPFIHFHLAKTAAIIFNCGCCTWSRYLRVYNNAEVRRYFKVSGAGDPARTFGYDIRIPNSPFTAEKQYIEVVNIDQPQYNQYKFPDLPTWMQQYLLKRLEHAKALLAIYEAGIKKLEEEIKQGRAS